MTTFIVKLTTASITLLVGFAFLFSTCCNTSICYCLSSEPDDLYSPSSRYQNKTDQNLTSPYVIIIDGGSTGSRLHIFEFVNDDEVIRHGSARANVPLSIYGPTYDNPIVDPYTVADHLIPAFRFAAKQIPKKYHTTTSVQYQATAGMRLLDTWQQDAVYDALYIGLLDHPDFVFKNMKRSDLQTLSGELEGYYGAVAANYLHGVCNAGLTLTDKDTHPIGALDMGGSSTQIVFVPKHNQDHKRRKKQKNNESQSSSTSVADQYCSFSDVYGDSRSQTCRSSLGVTKETMLHGVDEFFSVSYLSYGVDQFRERLWNHWVEEHTARQQNNDDCDSRLIENPCAFPGYELEWLGYTLMGTGNASSCSEEVNRLIPHDDIPVTSDESKLQKGQKVGGIDHPSVEGNRFVAMSLYFFSLDSLRELSGLDSLNRSWPNPSIQELVDALPALCSRNWHNDLYKIQHNAHKFTRAEVLPHRCLESVYMVTLLRDGFGFAPESRDITFLYEMDDGNEVEWTLGMALAIKAASSKKLSEFGCVCPESKSVSDVDDVTITSETNHSNDLMDSVNDDNGTTGSDQSYQLLLYEFNT